MNVIVPPSAFFLPETTGQNNGVDFLGLRQTNLDMMADLIPGTNNVTAYIRPFSLLSWIFWKYHILCVDNGIDEPDSASLEAFRERIEILFTWGARIYDYPSIPGKQAEPPAAGSADLVPLTFKDWKRFQNSTSLIAALWYGPASKVVTGLGLLMPVPGRAGFFRTVGQGVKLAQALDEKLRTDVERYNRLLATLNTVSANEADAKALWALWRPDTLSIDEQNAFREVLSDARSAGDYKSLLGRRSSTLGLVQLHLAQAGCSQSVEEIRKGMMLSQRPDGSVYAVPDELKEARDRWVILQVRQLQRLALESLLSWCETKILGGARDTAGLVSIFAQEWDESDYPFIAAERLGDLLAMIEGCFAVLDEFVACCRNETIPSPLSLIGTIQEEFATSGGKYAAHCLYGLLICAAFAGCVDPQSPALQLGGRARVSLYHLRRRLVGLGDTSIREAMIYVLEAMVISQHFATAVNRFDGQNQRLRIAIEETGLVPLVGSRWQPTVTEDRLHMLLSLAADCGILGGGGNGRYLSIT